MTNLKQFVPLVIHEFEESSFRLPLHTHTYYELIYILKGSGIHHINANKIHYSAGDLFLLAPGDEHYFEIKVSTHFTFIKFTDGYFNQNKHLSKNDALLSTPEALMKHKLLKEVKLEFNEPCKTILRNTIENISSYNCLKDVSTSPLIYYQILSIFGLIKEAIVKRDADLETGMPDKETLISYVHQHIYEPEQILIKNIAAHFHISDNYFSAYFKRNFACSYRDYTNRYRIRLIEQRLAAGRQTLKQIADEFGFTDESHLSNYFRKQNDVSPTQYRKAVKDAHYN